MRGVLVAIGAIAAVFGGLSMLLVWIAFRGTQDQIEHNRAEIFKLWGGLAGLAGIVLMIVAVSYL